MRRYLILTLGLLIFLLSVGSAGAVTELDMFKHEHFQGGPWRIRAERLTYDAANHIYIAEGQVEIRQGDRRISADHIEVNEATKIARVKGHVVLVLGEDIFAGQEGQFNLATRCGEMQGARLFLNKNHFHVDSPLMRKTGEHTYYAEEAKVTTCDADKPVWSFSARKLSVVLEGYATGRDGIIQAGRDSGTLLAGDRPARDDYPAERFFDSCLWTAPGGWFGGGSPVLLGHQQ